MTAESETLSRFLDAADLVLDGAPRPDNPTDAASVLAAVHRVDEALGGLHDQIAGCFGPIDATGRCSDCGRLVVPGMWRAHKDGPGCLYAVPLVSTAMWLFHHREGIPMVGNLLWRYRRRKDAHITPSDLPPSGGGM